jgi:hypothetical protein
MRISLLLRREPFGLIVEETLSRFLNLFAGKPFVIEWHENPPFDIKPSSKQQVWLCNIYLNAIFTPNVNPIGLAPLRREFGYSPIWYRRPLQRLYTDLAGRKVTSRLLAQKSVSMTPPLENADDYVFVGGNHKLRLLDNAKGLVHSVLKSGSEPKFVQQEIEARQMAARLGIFIPELTHIDTENLWFSERLIVGVPVNRLKSQSALKSTCTYLARKLSRLLDETSQITCLGDYVEHLAEQISQLTAANALLSDREQKTIAQITASLLGGLEELSALEWTLARTHGDFQPANMLANQNETWLIDWEYSAQRQIHYDWLVCGLRSRFPRGLAERLQAFIDTGTLYLLSDDEWKSPRDRRISVLVFCLEEILLHLEENANPRFFELLEGFPVLIDEINRWLGLRETAN